MNQLTADGYEKACDYFRKAVAKDPSYALAYVGVARCQDTPEKYRDGVIKALALDPSLADAHTRLGISKLTGDWDWPGAEGEYRQAIALNPNDDAAHHWYSFYLVAMGRPDEALKEIERARDLDPYDALTTVWLEQVLYHARRFDDALRENQRGLEMHPNASVFYWNMADIYEQKKKFAEAFAARQQSLSLEKDPRVTALGEAYKRSGYKGYLLKQVEFELTHNPPYAAHCYALLNDEARALAALEAGYKTHEPGLLFIRTAPEWTPFVHRPVSATWSAASGSRLRQATRTESSSNIDRALCRLPIRCNGACPLANFSVTALGVSVRPLDRFRPDDGPMRPRALWRPKAR
jgi:Tfp pilus assembly protein PilF